MDYGDYIDFFQKEREEGEVTPLDTAPTIENEIERWFFSFYQNIKSLSGFEYQITITDFRHYFDTYPIPFKEYLIISVIKSIETKVHKYQKEKTEAKKQAANKPKK